MKHTALYLRVSTEAQADEGYSLAAQAEKLEAYCRNVLPQYSQIHLVDFSPVEISSTKLREMAARGEEITPWVPKGVADYIQRHGLYQRKEKAES